MIVQSMVQTRFERCTSSDYPNCPVARDSQEGVSAQARCPFLQDLSMQYCSAAPTKKYIPYNETHLSRCESNRHRYCETYVTTAQPEGPALESGSDPVEGIALPNRLYYSKNHFWLDLDEDGSFQIGIDGLLARVLGSPQQVTFLASHGLTRPEVVITSSGIDFHALFPTVVSLIGPNAILRAAPDLVSHDPYGSGWLFEGVFQSGKTMDGFAVHEGLLNGKDARTWMKTEVERLTAFVLQRTSRRDSERMMSLNDGGVIGPDVLKHLSREDALCLFNEFFSPIANLRR